MSIRHGLAHRWMGFVAMATLGSALIIGGTAPSASAKTLTNTKPSGLYQCDPYSAAITPSCLAGALSDFKVARAKEGLKPLALPSNFRSMTVPTQVFTLTNIERRDRGLPAFALLSSNLTSTVLYAANHALDPLFPSWTVAGGSNWASPKNSLWADFLWMYDDGLGSGNRGCTTSDTSECWGHRSNILAAYGAPRVMGAAAGSTGIATLMMGRDTHDWNLLNPYAPVGLRVRQLTNHRLRATWAAPAKHGPAITAYYLKRDGGAWQKITGLAWTSRSLHRGTHTVTVKSSNGHGTSPARTLRFVVK